MDNQEYAYHPFLNPLIRFIWRSWNVSKEVMRSEGIGN